jgi:hypothetical protein
VTVNKNRPLWVRVASVLLDVLFVVGVVTVVVVLGLAFIAIGAWKEIR